MNSKLQWATLNWHMELLGVCLALEAYFFEQNINKALGKRSLAGVNGKWWGKLLSVACDYICHTNVFEKTNTLTTTKNNSVLTDLRKICKIWEECIRDLFNDIRSIAPSNISSNASGPSIIKLVCAFSTFRNRKEDNVLSNVLELVQTE